MTTEEKIKQLESMLESADLNLQDTQRQLDIYKSERAKILSEIFTMKTNIRVGTVVEYQGERGVVTEIRPENLWPVTFAVYKKGGDVGLRKRDLIMDKIRNVTIISPPNEKQI